MILPELRDRLRRRIGNPSVTDVPDSDLDTHINGAYQFIWNRYRFRARRGLGKLQTVAGSPRYSISPVTDIIYQVWDRTNGRRLVRIGTRGMAERDYVAAVAGRPEAWNYVETYLHLFPTPDGVYEIEFEFKRRFEPLRNVDAPVIPEPWHQGIVVLAAAMYYEDQAIDPMKAQYHRNLWKDFVSDMPVELHEETESVDSAVSIPTLGSTKVRTPDGIWWDIEP